MEEGIQRVDREVGKVIRKRSTAMLRTDYRAQVK